MIGRCDQEAVPLNSIGHLRKPPCTLTGRQSEEFADFSASDIKNVIEPDRA